MPGLLILGLIVAVAAIIGLAASHWGVDSRIGFDGGEHPSYLA